MRNKLLLYGLLAAVFSLGLTALAGSQERTARHVILTPMANMSQPADLDFEGGGCDVEASGIKMNCAFQQVLISPPLSGDPETCTITTNRYEQQFQKQDAQQWVSNSGPDGICGVVVVTTIRQEQTVGNVWEMTMNTRKIVTNKTASPICTALDEQPESLSWNYNRRALPCKFIKASSIGQ